MRSKIPTAAYCLMAVAFNSFDQPIRPRQQIWIDGHADLLRRLEIHHQLELHRLLHRKVGGLGSLQDSVHLNSRAPIQIDQICSAVHESASLCKRPIIEPRRQSALCRKAHNPV